MRKPLWIMFLSIALITMACGINFNLPVTEVKTGPTQTDEINIPIPESAPPIDLDLSFGAGKIKINSGAENSLLSGKAIYNVSDFKPEIEIEGRKVTIKQGNLNIKGFPNFEDKIENEWDFQLGKTPVNLKISAGAYSGQYELGGLSIQNLEIMDGASDVNLEFSEPNLVDMDTFRYNTGASNVTLEGLGNANFATMIFRSGAGSYKIDFSGEMRRDAVVSIESGISSMTIVVPAGVPVNLTYEGGLSNIDIFGAWKKSSDAVYTQDGTGAKLTILIKMSAGSLELRNR